MKKTACNFIARHSLQAVLFVVAVSVALGCAPAGRAGSLSTAVTGMFPKEVGEFAYADLKAARAFPWFSQLREQLLPAKFRQFEQFLTSSGVDPNASVDEVAWASTAMVKGSQGGSQAGAQGAAPGGEEVVGVALGTFNPSATEDRFKQQKLPMIEVHGYHLYAFGSGSGPSDILFTFIDANTAAFGHRAALEKMIDVRSGVAPSLLTNDILFPLINETNGTGIIWAVMDQDYTHLGVQQLLPQMSQFPQATVMIQRLKGMTVSVSADDGIDAHFQTLCSTSDDANLLAAALQAGILYRRYQQAQSEPALASALDQVRVSPAGDRLKIEIPLSQDQLLGLVSSHAFSAPN